MQSINALGVSIYQVCGLYTQVLYVDHSRSNEPAIMKDCKSFIKNLIPQKKKTKMTECLLQQLSG